MAITDVLPAAGIASAGVERDEADNPGLLRYLWIAPIAISLLITTLYPLIFLISLALSKSSLGKPFKAFAGLKNFTLAFYDAQFLTSVAKTVVYAFSSSGVQLALGLAVALLFRNLLKKNRILVSLLLLPLITPPVMVGVAWKLILAPAGGLLNGTLINWGLLAQPISFLGDPTLGWASIFIADLWQWTPFVAILSFAGLASLPEGVEEAAVMDGTTSWQRFWFITLPLIAAPLASIYLIKLIFSFKLFDLVYTLTYGGPGFATTTTGFSIYRLAMQQFEVGQAAAQTLIFATLIGLLTIPVVRLHRRLEAKEL